MKKGFQYRLLEPFLVYLRRYPLYQEHMITKQQTNRSVRGPARILTVPDMEIIKPGLGNVTEEESPPESSTNSKHSSMYVRGDPSLSWRGESNSSLRG